LNIFDRAKLAVQAFNAPNVQNSGSLRDARAFLKYGNGKLQQPGWSQTVLSDQDAYTGLMQGAIGIRSVMVASLATNDLHTKANSTEMKKARASREPIVHPYLEVIDKSKTFSNYQFWSVPSVYLDLEGIFYIMAIRAVGTNGVVGKVQEFKLLNPYMVTRQFDASTGELVGYTEYKGSMSRVIPKEMIIPIINLNPFGTDPFSLVDAAKDSQFTLKTANDYTRNAIANNINAPGIITTDQELDEQQLANFKARVTSGAKGEPIFGGGAGSIDWKDMQQDLNKAALKDVNSISLQNIIAVTGASKTMMGWEESGTTRDTALVQKDNFIEFRAMPQLQLIIDALNQDYKNYYNTEYIKNGYTIEIENPLGTDLTEEQKKIDNRAKGFDLYASLHEKGYDRERAARYAEGDIELEELGEPTVKEEPKPEPVVEPTEENELTVKEKFLQQMESGIMGSTQASLQNTVTNIDNRLLAIVAKKVGAKNEFETQDDLIGKRERNTLQNELELALATFYGIIMPLAAYNTMSERLEQYGKSAQFTMNNDVKRFIREVASKTSNSHIDTLLNSMMKQAQKDALAGLPRDQIVNNLINKYGGEISKTRAVAVARTEANRAFTMSQYEADKQFIRQSGMHGKAYKQWVTTSDNPCAFCIGMANQAPVPFDEPFASVGDELTATAEIDGSPVVKKMSVGFLDAQAGSLHVNCGCRYELIIQGA
jgi:hypothetical protein